MLNQSLLSQLPYPLRSWQQRALQHYLAVVDVQKNYLADITPGAGKTLFAIAAFLHLKSLGISKSLVVVTHTDGIRSQWIEKAAAAGLTLNRTIERSSADGFIVSYQQLLTKGTAETVAQVTQGRQRYLVVFDEIHHAGDQKDWSFYLKAAFASCHRRLLLSGTPFRRDEAKLPYVRYVARLGQADFSYSYGEALSDGIVPPLFFPTFGGATHWQRGEQEMTALMGAPGSKTDATAALNTAITDRNWLKTVLADAHSRLMELRQWHPQAGGLIVAKDQNHARLLDRLVRQALGAIPALVISDEAAARSRLAEFTHSDIPWLIAVRMVSEGIDIPRLRVGVYATNIRTELFFRQMVGRLTRLVLEDGLTDQSVYFYLPQHPQLEQYAHDLAQQRQHSLRLAQPKAQHDRSSSLLQTIGLSAEAIMAATLMPGGEFSETELERARSIRAAAPEFASLSIEMIAKLLRIAQQQSQPHCT